MRKFKTGKKNRTNYIFKGLDGKTIVITPEDVGSTWITILHEEDDEEVDDNRRADYLAPVHYAAYSGGENTDIADHNVLLADKMSNPLERMIHSIDEAEHENRLDKLQAAIKTLQPQQQELIKKVFYQNRTNVDIAAEEGVTEAAVRNRLKKIYANLAKKLQK